MYRVSHKIDAEIGREELEEMNWEGEKAATLRCLVGLLILTNGLQQH